MWSAWLRDWEMPPYLQVGAYDELFFNKPKQMSSAEQQRAAYRCIQQACKATLAGYTTSMNEDRAAADQGQAGTLQEPLGGELAEVPVLASQLAALRIKERQILHKTVYNCTTLIKR